LGHLVEGLSHFAVLPGGGFLVLEHALDLTQIVDSQASPQGASGLEKNRNLSFASRGIAIEKKGCVIGGGDLPILERLKVKS